MKIFFILLFLFSFQLKAQEEKNVSFCIVAYSKDTIKDCTVEIKEDFVFKFKNTDPEATRFGLRIKYIHYDSFPSRVDWTIKEDLNSSTIKFYHVDFISKKLIQYQIQEFVQFFEYNKDYYLIINFK